MKATHTIRIRMGAAHWDATLLDQGATFNFRAMTSDDRKKFYGVFMGSVRKLYRKGNRKHDR